MTPKVGWKTAPRVLLAVFCLILLVVASTRDGRGFESNDVRQYGEMIGGVAAHGVPRIDNGPADRFVALRVPWNVFVNGGLWGTYAPAYAYLGAAAVLLGGWRLVWVVTFGLLVPLAIVTFMLARRVVRSEWYALLAAVGTVASTPILGKALEMTAYPLTALLVASGALAAAASSDARGRRRLALATLAGAIFGLGTAAHLLCFPIGAAAVLVLAVSDADARAPAFLARTPLRGLWPSRASLVLAGCAAGALALTLLPVAWLNRLRFGSFAPLSYGPTPWPGAFTDQNVGAHLRYAAPTIGVVLAMLGGYVAGLRARGPRAARVLAVLVAALLLGLSPLLRDRTLHLARMAWIVIVDTSLFDLSEPYRRIPGAPGHLVGPWVLKATLQATPVLALVLVLPALDDRRRRLVAGLLVPAAALFAYLAMRANLDDQAALGWAWVSFRYTLPALPLLFPLAVVVVEEVAPGRWHWAIGLATAAGLLLFLRPTGVDDGPDAARRHVVLLWVPLAVAAIAVASVVLRRRAVAAIVLPVLVGLGFGIALGHDLPSHIGRRVFSDWKVASVAGALPHRFAVYGLFWSMDQMLGLRMERDVEYADTHMVGADPAALRPLLEHWWADGRPVFYVDDGPDRMPASPWPDVRYVPVEPAQGLYRAERIASP